MDEWRPGLARVKVEGRNGSGRVVLEWANERASVPVRAPEMFRPC